MVNLSWTQQIAGTIESKPAESWAGCNLTDSNRCRSCTGCSQSLRVRREEQAVVIYQNVKRILTGSLSRGCYRNWVLGSERKSIITEWKLHFVFATGRNENWLFNLKGLAAGVSRLCSRFCISRSFITVHIRYQALQCCMAVQIGQNRKRLQGTQEGLE